MHGKRVIIENLVVDQKLFETDMPMVNEENKLHSSITDCLVKPEGKKGMSWNEFVRGYVENK